MLVPGEPALTSARSSPRLDFPGLLSVRLSNRSVYSIALSFICWRLLGTANVDDKVSLVELSEVVFRG